ncbi:MAG: PilZ domain-containing protein [Candidatus Omnitrophica bacterium]|nr:PilZ domain-containing protein [Candidatus Omnitrophota bacterium]
MLLIMELFLIALLGMIVFLLIKNQKINSKKTVPHAKLEEYWDGKERRRHFRFHKELVLEYKLLKNPHSNKNCRTINISEGGLKLYLDDKLLKGTIMQIEIEIPEAKLHGEIEGEVVWTEDADSKDGSGKRFFYSGIKFLRIEEPFRTKLGNYIRSLVSGTRS